MAASIDNGGRTMTDVWLARTATGLTVLLPLGLLYARAIADTMLSVVGVLFLISLWRRRDWTWLRTPWTRLALVFWGWMLICTLIVGNEQAVVQALASIRFFLLVPALECWVLRPEAPRKWLWYGFLAGGVWILIEAWQQAIFGLNVFGYPRWLDGALTGPFRGPTAGPTYLLLFFPAFLPLCFLMLRRGRRLDWLHSLAILTIAAATMVMIGQRMPALLMAFGLCITGLLYRQVRLPVLLAIGGSLVVLALLPVISPPAFAKLVLKFTEQMEHFWDTPYGLVFGRAATMVQAHPWIGLGWDGYRDNCMNPAYLGGVAWLPIKDPAAVEGCLIHPHNYWLQIATSAGLPGVALFAALVGLWLWRIRWPASMRLPETGRPEGVNRTTEQRLGVPIRAAGGMLAGDRRAAVLVIVFVVMWPIASTTSLFTVPNAGWIFLLVGWGLAEARS